MSGKLTRAELEQQYLAGTRQFQSVDLSGEDLQGLDLRGVDLQGSDLTRTKLFRTNLEDSNLTECNMSGLYLAGTHLSNATARRANLRGCRMDGVKWSNIDLDGARLDQVNLRGSELSGCSLRRTGLAEADLSEARLVEARAYGVFVEGSCWHKATIVQSRFNNGRLSKTDFGEAQFQDCIFEGADLSHCNCAAAGFENCQFVDTEFSNSDLSDCDLTSARFLRARLSGTKLNNSRLGDASLYRANLSRANLSNADLSNSRLGQADLSRADLREVNLQGAVLDGADLSFADVVDTKVDNETSFKATKTIGVDFGTNWSLRQRVMDSSHELTIRQFRRKHPVLGFFWWLLLGCGKRNYLLLVWGIAIVFGFAGLMALHPSSFSFGQTSPTFWDHCQNSLAVFVTLDLAVDKGTDAYGRGVMLVQMLLSYLMLGFMASLFSSIFPHAPE